jgi:hypothetical protein
MSFHDRTSGTISALALPALDPGTARREVVVPVGATVAEIVAKVVPGVPAGSENRLRVLLVSEAGQIFIRRQDWRLVRPKPGVRVVIRFTPGKGLVNSLLQIVVLVAAVALGQLWAVPLSGALGISTGTAQALITAGVTALGNLALNALIQPRDEKKERQSYAISGLQNRANPDGRVPVLFGRMRVAPLYAAPPYVEIVGDIQYIVALFVWGYGPLALSDLRLGKTSLDDFDEVQIETRTGLPDDEPQTLYPQQVLQDNLAAELTRPWERDDAGEVIDGGTTVATPVTRVTASDAASVSVIIGFPGGLARMDDEGKRKPRTVRIRVRQRAVGEEAWTFVRSLAIRGRKTEPMWREFRWSLPERGAYEIELTRITDESLSTRVSDKSVWTALKSFRPEYPINFPHPLALTAIRIKATYQLNGQLEDFNGIASRIAPDWDELTGTWITRETRSPAAAFRWVLQGPASTFPQADSAVDLDQLADFSEFCAAKGLRYDRMHDFEGAFLEALADIASAGRASPRHDGTKWGLVIDRPTPLVVDHIGARNSRGFKRRRTYLSPPDAFRIPFLDETNDWQKGERLVPWPGHVGPIEVTEKIDLPGKTNPDEIWIEARRRMYELIHRPDQYQLTQDGLVRVATRGDQVAVAHDGIAHAMLTARVKRVVGQLVVLDETVTIEPDTSYVIRFTGFADDDDAVGTSVLRTVASEPGEHSAVRLSGTGALPRVDELVIFGTLGSESLLAFVRAEERGEDGSTTLHLVAAAPIVDELTDAEVPPAWDGRVGSPIGSPTAIPAAPLILLVASGATFGDDPETLMVDLAPGNGSAAVVGSFEIDHRLVGAPGWTTTEVLVAEGGAEIEGYSLGDQVEVRARSVSIYGVEGPYTDTVTHVIGSSDPVTPQPLTFAAEQLSSGFWRFSWTLPPADSITAILGVRIRGKAGDWPTWADLDPLQTGLLTSSPWETTGPTANDVYTFGIVAVSSSGVESEPLLITQSSAAVDILGTGDGDVLDTGDGSFLSTS